jgi:hypothetical protein
MTQHKADKPPPPPPPPPLPPPPPPPPPPPLPLALLFRAAIVDQVNIRYYTEDYDQNDSNQW